MYSKAKRTAILGIFLNAFLFIIKLTAGIMSGSLAIISDALNSFMDIITAIAIFISVKISRKKADISHPFGHHRAEPIAGLIVAILAGIVGFEIIRNAVQKIISREPVVFSAAALIILIACILIKLFMFIYFSRVGKSAKSPAIRASAIDSLNDVFATSVALVGFISTKLNLAFIDAIAAGVIGVIILHYGFKIGRENIDYLMGHKPNDAILKEIISTAIKVKGVNGVHNIKAHYVGTFIHVEVQIEVSDKLSAKAAHDIGEKVEKKISDIEDIDDVFVHIDPICPKCNTRKKAKKQKK